MNIKKLVIDITNNKLIVSVNGVSIGGIQNLDLNISAKEGTSVKGAIEYWKKEDSDGPSKLEDLKSDLSSCFGPYATAFDTKKLRN